MERILLIRLSIEKLNELPGPYGFQKGLLIGKAVPAGLLKGMTILEGDSLRTLKGQEYVTLTAIKGDRDVLEKEVEPRINSNAGISLRKAEPLTMIVAEVEDPLSSIGAVQNGRLKENGWCSKGFIYAWS